MATEPEEHLHATEDETEAGGPVKSFLEHLEDLRWTLLKVFSSLLLAMLQKRRLIIQIPEELKHLEELRNKQNNTTEESK